MKTYTEPKKLEFALRFLGLTLHEVPGLSSLRDSDEWATWETALVRSFVLDTIKDLGDSIWRIRVCYILNYRRPTQMCRQLNVPRVTLRRWVKGTLPDVRHRRLIEHYLIMWPDPPSMARRGWTQRDHPHPNILVGMRPWLLEDGTYQWCYAKDVPTAVRRLMQYQLKGRKETK